MKRHAWIILASICIIFLQGCAYKILFLWERNVWKDLRGIITMVEPADLKKYRQLLPDQFEMPDQPMVGVYFFDFLDMEPWMVTFTSVLKPYKEATVLLRCKYQNQEGWHPLTMPVSDEVANIAGRRLGFPKYVADNMSLAKTDSGWEGIVKHLGQEQISLKFMRGPIVGIKKLPSIQEAFIKGVGPEANLDCQIFLLVPPTTGPYVKVIHTSPPSRVNSEAGMVRIELADPWNSLIPNGTLSPGLFERFALDPASIKE